MTLSKLRIISRESPLAMWQAEHVRACLHRIHPQTDIEIIGVKTEADRFLNMSLEKLGGKGAFVKELEQALYDNVADIAVHSMKDVTIELPPQFSLPVIMEREDVRDVLVSNHYGRLEDLPENGRVGTSSLRRQCQINAIRPDLDLIPIRGNVGTRLKKLDDGQFDALILAAAGVKRLGLQERVKQYLAADMLLPAIGQGALGIETRFADHEIGEFIQPLNEINTYQCVTAERAVSQALHGDCHAPIAAHALINNGELTLRGLVGKPDGSEILRASINGTANAAAELGAKLGQELLAQGAGDILQELRAGADN